MWGSARSGGLLLAALALRSFPRRQAARRALGESPEEGEQVCPEPPRLPPGTRLIVSLPSRGNGIRSLLSYQRGSLASCGKDDILGDTEVEPARRSVPQLPCAGLGVCS